MTDIPSHVTSREATAASGSRSATLPYTVPTPHYLADASGAMRPVDNLFTLGQNYPNPHSGETTVPFMLTVNADVHLDLFDQLGRKMASVLRKGRIAGPQNIKLNLDGLGLPAGDYIYRLQVSSRFGMHQQTKQMTIV